MKNKRDKKRGRIKHRQRKEIMLALEFARIISLSFQKLYKTTDLSEMMSLCDYAIAECWKKRKKIKHWNRFIKKVVRNTLNGYIRGEVKKKKFRVRLERRRPDQPDDND